MTKTKPQLPWRASESVEPTLRTLASITEVAKSIGVSEQTIRRMISTGQLTAYRFGKRLIRIDVAELEALLRPIPAAR